MKRIMNNLLLAGMVLLSSLAYAKTGLLFKITQSGAPAAIDVILCLNGTGPLSCQNYHVSAQDLRISTTASHHYPAAGIKVLTPGYQATGCTPYSNGYCLFATSNTKPAAIHLNSRAQKQNQTITFTSTPPSSPTVGGTYHVAATASSGLPVTFTTTGACSISGSTVTFNATGTCTVNANQAGNALYNAAPQVQQNMSVGKQSQTITFTSTPPSSPTVGDTYDVAATASSGLTVAITVDSSSSSVCSISGSTVTFNAAGTCTVNANQAGNAQYNAAPQLQQTITVVATFPVAKGPSNVFAVPGNGQATISWTAPSNTGTGTITGYTVTYGLTSGTTFTTVGCTAMAPSSTCTVTGLTNGTAYTFAVSTVTQKDGLSQTGPASLSSSITPTDGLVVSPSTLALSGLGSGGLARTITLTNTSATSITLDAVPTTGDFNPALPSGTTVSATTCTTTAIASGDSCTLTITPGATVSSNNSSALCTTGVAPEFSTISITGNSGAVTATANVVVLGYGCQYQGGYLFSIDDTTPNTESIGGKVVATTNQTNDIEWSPGGAFDSIWGIDDASTSAVPSPNDSSTYPATFQAGQLNCDAVNDGTCATHNIQVFYSSSPLTSYAAGLCRQPLTGANNATLCSGGPTCYTDWYLPSTCDLGPFGSTGVNTGNYPSRSGSQSCIPGSTNIQQQLMDTSIASISGSYWGSTEYSVNPQLYVWLQYFVTSGGNQFFTDKANATATGVRCVRGLTH